ncbi:MAG: LamG-like jellyroll fold domain-containing protein, partial [Pirellulales bacterium]
MRKILLATFCFLLAVFSVHAGQEFDDGVNEGISLGSDASIDDLNPFTIACWVDVDDFASDQRALFDKPAVVFLGRFQTDGSFQLFHDFTGDLGDWRSDSTISTGVHHIVVSYDDSSTSNDPTMYFDLTSS